MQPDPEIIRSSALWHLYDYQLDQRQFTLLKISDSLYRSASFLDQRVVQETIPGVRFELAAIESLFPSGTPAHSNAMYIFHVGHCGSTLLSRALGASPEVLPLREPLTLRRLAAGRRSQEQDQKSMLGYILRALQRNFHRGQTPVIKATSTCNNLIEPILQYSKSYRAIAMYVPLESYLAGMLGKQSPALDLRGHLATRLSDWNQSGETTGLELHDPQEAQLAVLAWITSMRLILRARENYPEQLNLLDFERFLQDPQTQLFDTADFFGLGTETGCMLEAYPDISTGYSKQPDVPYSAYNRNKTLQRGRLARGEEIRQGLRWAEELTAATPSLRSFF